MPTIRIFPPRLAGFALKPSLVRALWHSIQDGAAAPAIDVTYANGVTVTLTGRDPVSVLLRPGGKAIRAVILSAAHGHQNARRAVFEAGDLFIENECTLSGPEEFLRSAAPRLKRGMASGFWQYPDGFAILTSFVILFAFSAMVSAHRAGYSHLPAAVQRSFGLLLPLLLVLRAWLPPAILIAHTDKAFERAAVIRRNGLILAVAGGLFLPVAMVAFGRG